MTQAQSLGDVAREQKQKQQQAKPRPHKVVTNDDLPAHSEDTPDSPSTASKDSHESTGSPSGSAAKPNAEEWKARIQKQKSNVAALQSNVDQLKASVHYVEANAYTNGVQYNQAQKHKQDEADRLQKQLDEQKKSLSDMQESCRRAGLGGAICQP